MKTTLILTLIGNDRPGLVGQVSALISSHGGQWLNSQFLRLEGQFAGILQLAVPSGRRSSLQESLHALADNGLKCVIEEGQAPALAPSYPLRLNFTGQDRPGVIKEISEILTAQGVTIQRLESECAPAPMSGEMLFSAVIEAQVPLSVSCDTLIVQLEGLTPDLMIDSETEEQAAS